MATLASLVVKVGIDAKGMDKGLGTVQTKLDSFGQQAARLGTSLTTKVSLPLAGIGGVALAMSTDFNKAMANVATLIPGQIERVNELKASVQDMAVETGKSTDDLAGGLFQVISAFGDSADTVKILEINARAAKAGVAETADAINLTSAVTKAYGDTSAEAVQRIADLAFKTNELGQTTFPELASSMGAVAPLAATLGVSAEELFGQFAALTGVTGNTSEVATQLRATYQALLKPTTDMASAISEVAIKLDEQGKLAAGPLVASWEDARNSLGLARNRLSEMTSELEDLETQMAGSSASAQALKDAIKQQKLEAQENVIALKQQLQAIDTSTEAGKNQAAAIKDQIQTLKLASDARVNELQQQLLAASGAEELKNRYRELQASIRDQTKAVDESQAAVDEAAAALGSAVVQSIGFNETLSLVSATAEGNTNTLGQMFGSVESLNAVLALGGAQAESLTAKTGAMMEASGAAATAFDEQTQGINANGFAMEQLQQKVTVAGQEFGDGLAPALSKALDAAMPLIDAVVALADKFANADPEVQTMAVTIGAIAAGVGPVLVVLGTLVSTLGTLVGATGTVISIISGGAGLIASIAAVANPVGIVVTALVGLALAWKNNWFGIRDHTKEVIDWIENNVGPWIERIVGFFSDLKTRLVGNSIVPEMVSGIIARFMNLKDDAIGLIVDLKDQAIGEMVELKNRIIGSVSELKDKVKGAVQDVFTAWTSKDWVGAGSAVKEGILTGLGGLKEQATGLIGDAARATKSKWDSFWGSKSPSRLMIESAGDIMAGLEVGFKRGEASLVATVESVGQTVAKRLTDTLRPDRLSPEDLFLAELGTSRELGGRTGVVMPTVPSATGAGATPANGRNNQTWNVVINSNAPVSTIRSDLEMLRAMAMAI